MSIVTTPLILRLKSKCSQTFFSLKPGTKLISLGIDREIVKTIIIGTDVDER